MNRQLQLLHEYPFSKLRALLQNVQPSSDQIEISLAVGEPQAGPPDFVVDALRAALDKINRYPATRGETELRLAIAKWICRRYGLASETINAEKHILPLQGTREGLFSIAQVIVDAQCAAIEKGKCEKPLVILPSPFYQIYEGAAILAGAEPLYLPCDSKHGFALDFGCVSEAQWKRCQLVYLCNPSNPTGAVLSTGAYTQLLALADRYDFVVVSDECYSEIYSDEDAPCTGLLEVCAALGRSDYSRCLVFNSLSKRSNLAGMRSGFVAGDATLIEAYLLYRTYHGSAMPFHHQAASIVAWDDEGHVIANRQAYRAKLESACAQLRDYLPVELPAGGFCLWVKTPCSDEAFARELYAKKNVVALPGRYLARSIKGLNHGENFVRLALVQESDLCEQAVERIVDYVRTIL